MPARIGFTSALPGEGVSFVARAVALVLAHDYRRAVCLVDLNWGSPTSWPSASDTGLVPDLVHVLRDGASIDRAVRTTGIEELCVVPAGTATPADRPVLAHTPLLDEVLTELSTRFDHVFLDLPAVHSGGDALPLARKAGGVVLVIAAGSTTEAQVERAVADLGAVPILGAVVNRQSSAVPRFIRRRFGV